MKFELEQAIRNEARALKQAGCLGWDRRLLANGLDPERWSDESAEVSRAVAEPAEIIGETVGALKRELEVRPELFFSTRTAADDIYGFRAADLQSFDDASNTLACTWTTGAAVLRMDCMGLYNEVLDVSPKAVRLGRLNAGASFLNSHRSDDLAQVLGSVVRGSAKIEGGIGTCRVLLSKAAGCADTIGNIKAGVIRNVSVGYLIHAAEWTDGDAGIPTCIVRDWEPIEISAVAVPADPGAQFRFQPVERRRVERPHSADPAVDAALARMHSKGRRLGIY